jgi:hypothetical protein
MGVGHPLLCFNVARLLLVVPHQVVLLPGGGVMAVCGSDFVSGEVDAEGPDRFPCSVPGPFYTFYGSGCNSPSLRGLPVICAPTWQ